MALPKVTVLSLGGTISSTETGGNGVEPTRTGEALVEDVPEISQVAEVSAESFRQVPGSELTMFYTCREVLCEAIPVPRVGNR